MLSLTVFSSILYSIADRPVHRGFARKRRLLACRSCATAWLGLSRERAPRETASKLKIEWKCRSRCSRRSRQGAPACASVRERLGADGPQRRRAGEAEVGKARWIERCENKNKQTERTKGKKKSVQRLDFLPDAKSRLHPSSGVSSRQTGDKGKDTGSPWQMLSQFLSLDEFRSKSKSIVIFRAHGKSFEHHIFTSREEENHRIRLGIEVGKGDQKPRDALALVPRATRIPNQRQPLWSVHLSAHYVAVTGTWRWRKFYFRVPSCLSILWSHFRIDFFLATVYGAIPLSVVVLCEGRLENNFLFVSMWLNEGKSCSVQPAF